MTDITLVPITGAHNLSAINNNFSKVQEAINNDVLNLDGGNNVMQQDLDMNGNQLLNIGVDVNNPGSLLTVAAGDSRYYNVSGDTLTGPMSVNGQVISGLAAAIASTSPLRKGEFDDFVSTLTSTAGAFQQAGAGALVRTYQDKMRDFVSEGDFATAQEGAIAALGKVYFVPEGVNLTVTVPTDASTLTGALSAVAQWHIPASSLLTIKVNEGLYVSDTVVPEHPNADNILITGEDVVLTNSITSINSTSGVRGNYLVTLNVGSSAGLAVGNWVVIKGTTGTGKFRGLNGFYEVTAVGSPTTVQVRVRLWDAAFPTMTLTAGGVYKVRTLLKFLNKDGVVIVGSSVSIRNLGVIGNMWDYWLEGDILGTEKGTHGVYVASNTIVDGTGTPGGANPYGLSGGGLACVNLHVADFDQQGFTAAGGAGIFGYDSSASSCGRRCFYVGTSAAMEFRRSMASTAYRDGVIADYNGAFNASGFNSNGNRLAGGFANNGGTLICPNSNFTGNLFGIDIRAGSNGLVDASLLILNTQNGASFEYGASGSISGATITDNGVDGAALIFGSSVRATNAIINNNGRYGINLLGSYIGIAGATITGNVTANINTAAASVVFDGTNYEPTNNPVRVYDWTVTDTAKVHNTKGAVSSIGDFSLSLNAVARLVLKTDGTLHPSGVGTQTAGRDANRWSAVYALRYLLGATGSVGIRTGTGTPEGAVTDVVGSLFLRSDGGASTTLYVKQSGTGNTGWVAK